MTNKKSTKRALLMSVLSLFLCVAMLAGTTFAWFTDSVASKNNIITTGNLDVELEYKKVEKGVLSPEWETVGGRDDIFDPNAYWEPGRVEVVYLKVSNLGSLALKYQLGVNVVNDNPGTNVDGDTFYLSEHLVFKTVLIEEKDVGTYTRATAVEDGDTLGFKDYNGKTTALEVGGADYVAMIVYMPETVGNVANHKKSDDPLNPAKYAASIEFGINLLATQYSVEDDSYGDDYDGNAWLPDMIVYNAADLKAAVSNGGKVQLGASVVLPETIEIPAGVSTVVNLNGYDLTAANETVNVLKNGGELTIIGKGTITTRNMYNATGAKLVIDGDITINGGALFAGSAIWNEGDAVIRGVTLNQNNTTNYAVQHFNNGTLTLDDVTVNGQHGGVAVHNGTVTIKGGTFTNANEQHAGHTLYVTGGEVIVEGGTFTHDQENASAHGNALIYTTNGAVTINGGTFDSEYAALTYTGMNVTITAGTFANKGASVYQQTTNEGISEFVATDYAAVDNGNGTYTVVDQQQGGLTLSLVAGYPGFYTDGTNYYVYDAQGLIAMNKFWADNSYGNNMWGRSYNVMANIDATGYTWNSVWVNVGYNGNDGFVLDGHGNTISGLKINGSMFTGTPNGGDAGTEPGKVKDLTFDNVTVVGDHWTAVVWGNTYGELVFENVHVLNSSITGKCNTAAFVGGTAQESGDVTVNFVNCSVKNTSISANGAFSGVKGDWASDPNGANVYLSRAFNDTKVTFDGCVSENNTVTNTNGVVGGGIYGYTALAGGWWAGIGTCDTFTNWNGLSAVESANDLSDALASGDDVVLSDDLTVTGSVVTTNGVTEAYGNKVGVAQYGGTLDGNGNTLTETGSSAYVIVTHGGTIKNLTIVGGGRGIVIYAPTEDVIIDNVVIDGPGYAINTAEHNGQNLIVTNSTLNGWTSLAGLDSVSFTNCKFGENSTKCWQNYGYDADYDRLIKPYGQASFTDCTFEKSFYIDLSALANDNMVTLTNCNCEGVVLTAENYANYITVELPNWANSIADCIVFG